MSFLPGLFSTPTATSIVLAVAAWLMFTTCLYLHRWLSSLAGHPIGQAPTVKHLP
jgi:hypothetical protein